VVSARRQNLPAPLLRMSSTLMGSFLRKQESTFCHPDHNFPFCHPDRSAAQWRGLAAEFAVIASAARQSQNYLPQQTASTAQLFSCSTLSRSATQYTHRFSASTTTNPKTFQIPDVSI